MYLILLDILNIDFIFKKKVDFTTLINNRNRKRPAFGGFCLEEWRFIYKSDELWSLLSRREAPTRYSSTLRAAFAAFADAQTTRDWPAHIVGVRRYYGEDCCKSLERTLRGQSLVVWAISEGRECARKVDEYLSAPPSSKKRPKPHRFINKSPLFQTKAGQKAGFFYFYLLIKVVKIDLFF